MASTYMPKVITNRGKTPSQIERDTFERTQVIIVLMCKLHSICLRPGPTTYK